MLFWKENHLKNSLNYQTWGSFWTCETQRFYEQNQGLGDWLVCNMFTWITINSTQDKTFKWKKPNAKITTLIVSWSDLWLVLVMGFKISLSCFGSETKIYNHFIPI